MGGGQFQTLLLGTCTFEPSTLTLRNAAGSVISLRRQSMAVLAELARSPGGVIARDALIEAVWPGLAVTDDSLVQCIKDIRAALCDADRQIVRTAVGRGYCLIARLASQDAADRPKILVEPFRATGGTDEAAELAESIFEEIVVRLTPRAGVSILTQASRRGEARYVIGGRATVRADRAHLFVKISRTDSGEDVHAVAEDAALTEIEGLARRLADKIASLLRIHMIVSDGSEYVDRDNRELSVQELMTKAAWHMIRFRRENWYAARAALEAAVVIAPNNPVILAMLASMATQMIPLVPFAELPDETERAMELATRAVEIGPSIDYVLRTRGNLRLWRLGDHEGALADCARALQINPVFHLAHLTVATSEILSDDVLKGAERLEEMMRRAPNDLQNPLYFSLIALANLLAGRQAEALAASREGFERNPFGSWNALVFAVAAAATPGIAGSEAFARMVARIDLPAEHFRHMPFREPMRAEVLVERALAAGVRP